jgi:bifunctional non-homologous end joining protein LigD
MPSGGHRFVVHRHKTGRPHYDLRFLHSNVLRCWSLLREPPQEKGKQMLAIERETFEAAAVDSTRFDEAAFGVGSVYTWDKGTVNVIDDSARLLLLDFDGEKLSGKYELKRMRWYPGNRWLLRKV